MERGETGALSELIVIRRTIKKCVTLERAGFLVERWEK
jgi:hypothetical protein